MANLGQGVMGAATGFATGGPVGAAIGGLSSLFGVGPQHEDPALRAMRQQQQQIGQKLYQYGTSVPGSSPDEMANMAQARGLLGQQQRQADQRVMGAYNPMQGGSPAQLLANLANSHIAQQMAQQSSFLQDAGANRRQALMNAANVGQSAAGMYKPVQSGFPQAAAGLAQQLAYQQNRNKGGGGQPDSPPSTTVGGPVQGPMLPGSNEWWQQLGASGGLGDPATTQGLASGAAPGETSSGPGVGGAPPGIAQMLAMFSQQMGAQPGMGGQGAPANGAAGLGLPPQWQGTGASIQGLQGAQAPGNEPGGMQTISNQQRQSMGASSPEAINSLLRKITLPGGLTLHF